MGAISIAFAGHEYQTNLVVFGAAFLCLTFTILLLFKFVELLINGFHYFGKQRVQRLRERASQSLTNGLIEYAEGRFDQSEKILLQHVNYSDNRLLVYLTAARAAQQLGAHERRDEYLRKAHMESPGADVAIGLTKAELQLAHEQNEQALATLSQLHKLSPEHTYVLTLLANTYSHLQDWDELSAIIPELKKSGHLSAESILGFEITVTRGKLSRLTQSAMTNNEGLKPLLAYWKQLSHQMKALPDIVEHYSRQLVSLGGTEEAEKVLRHYLGKTWVDSTIKLYSELDVVIDNKQLETVESWLDDHQHDAYLLLALGKRCIGRSLWGKARNYLEASIAIDPMPENYLVLARLLEEHMNDEDAAQEYYRQGLHLLAGGYSVEILDQAETDDNNEPRLKIVKS